MLDGEAVSLQPDEEGQDKKKLDPVQGETDHQKPIGWW